MTTEITPAKFTERSRKVVENFLQSAVILDDRASMDDPAIESVPSEVNVPSFDSPRLSQEAPPESSGRDEESSTLQGVPLYAKPIVDKFAELGCVCAVLKPEPSEDFQRKVVSGAAASDIVVLDWVIGDSHGDRTLEVIREIIKNDGGNERLRLIAIYTGETGLHDIMARVKSEVDCFYDDWDMEEEAFRVSKGPVTALVLAKQGTFGDGLPELKSREVPEDGLVDRLVAEFTRVSKGLLRNVALVGIANLRSNTHRLLTKLDGRLDPGYLGQRLLLENPSDAEEHLVEALGAELLSILQDSPLREQAGTEAIEEWLNAGKRGGLNLSSPFTFQSGDDVELWKSLLELGMDYHAIERPTSKNELRSRSTEAFTNNGETALTANCRYSALLNLKTLYSGLPPRLTQGTVLYRRCGKKRRYMLCIQPKCDSVRCKGDTGFPMVLMEIVDDPVKRFRLAVETGIDNWVLLDFSDKPSGLIVPYFTPDDQSNGEVVANVRFGISYFKDVEGNVYRWVAQMKDEHALKISGDVASSLARPGPNDSEWLRLASRRR